MRRHYRSAALLVLLVVFTGFPVAVRGQTGQNFGELVGKVIDDQGGLLPGATVTLTGPALMGARASTTNERGIYRFPAVPSGTYTLTFELAGFVKLVRTGLDVPIRQTVTVDVQLKVAALQETITVRGE